MVHIDSSPETQSAKKEQNQEAQHEIVKNYILDGIIEETYTHKGLTVTFRVPTQGQFMQQQEEIDREVFADDESISIDRTNMIRNNGLLSIYVTKYGNKDFVTEQGDNFLTKEGMLERKKYILESRAFNVYAMQWIIDKLREFQESVSEAFKEDNLKNSQ